jgi:hypothetical protein
VISHAILHHALTHQGVPSTTTEYTPVPSTLNEIWEAALLLAARSTTAIAATIVRGKCCDLRLQVPSFEIATFSVAAKAHHCEAVP